MKEDIRIMRSSDELDKEKDKTAEIWVAKETKNAWNWKNNIFLTNIKWLIV